MRDLANAAKEAKTGTAEARKKAEEDAAAIEAAFTRAAIKTKTELTNAAKTAKEDFELIKASGQATADGLQAAFKRYAEAAIAANNGVATDTLKSEAAMRGLQVQTDATGKAIVTAMGSGKQATDGFTGSVRTATTALEQQNAAMERAIAAQEKANDLKQRAIDLENKRLNQDKEGFSLNTAGNRAVSGESQASANQRVAQRYGNDQVGNADAIAATELARKIKEVRSNPEGSIYGLAPGTNEEVTKWVNELARLEQVIQAGKTKAAEQKTNATPSEPAAAQQGKTYTINISSVGSFTAKSDVDAQNLIALLQRAKLSA
ncbi:MAG: family phage tail tape measure protein [Comamonadaceae bacterium]|nr:MAG: family phage tail tape measure protein [Comamonadaceae bacterium]